MSPHRRKQFPTAAELAVLSANGQVVYDDGGVAILEGTGFDIEWWTPGDSVGGLVRDAVDPCSPEHPCPEPNDVHVAFFGECFTAAT